MTSHADTAPLAFLPTPLHALERFTQALGVPDLRVWIKRDDQTGLAGGGNKARKLTLLVPDALAAGADTLVTAGAVQSNHARQTAAAGAAAGLRVELVLTEERTEADYLHSGNALLNEILGARVHRVPAGTDLRRASDDLATQLRAEGRRPVVLPVGGSNPLGALSYAHCAMEIRQDADRLGVTFDTVVLGTGSGGTQAGLVAGFHGVADAPDVLGVCVMSPVEAQRAKVHPLVAPTLRLLGRTGGIEAEDLRLDDRFIGPGYGVPTPGMLEAVRLVARTEGVLLDPVYTGKAMAGLIALAREGRLTGDVLFLHTGGSAGLFAYRGAFNPGN